MSAETPGLSGGSRSRRLPSKAIRSMAAAVLLALGTSGCTEIESAMASVPFLNFMHESPAFDPYEAPRPAPANAVPIESPLGDWEPAVEATEVSLRAFGARVPNPLPASDSVLARGQAAYITYCSVCHGPQGHGDGPIVGAGKFPPLVTNLTSPGTVGRSDGYLYAIQKVGRGLMPAYRRMHASDRWAVVHYIRQLQGGGAQAAQGGANTQGQD